MRRGNGLFEASSRRTPPLVPCFRLHAVILSSCAVSAFVCSGQERERAAAGPAAAGGNRCGTPHEPALVHALLLPPLRRHPVGAASLRRAPRVQRVAHHRRRLHQLHPLPPLPHGTPSTATVSVAILSRHSSSTSTNGVLDSISSAFLFLPLMPFRW